MQVLITIDTEISPVEIEPAAVLAANVDQRIWGRAHGDEVGIAHKARTLRNAGLTGVFFVEALCASVVDPGLLREWVAVLQDLEQDVQLHVHSEWGQYLGFEPPAGLSGYNLAHYGHDDQRRLIGMALENLTAAGARNVCAFRAGNYAANDTTLSVLSELGLRFDSSYNQSYLGSSCEMSPADNHLLPFSRGGCQVYPVTNFVDGMGKDRHAQLCACSAWEMRQALQKAEASGLPSFVIVSHSFELFNMNRKRASWINGGRWRALLKFLSSHCNTLPVVGFETLDTLPDPADRTVGQPSVSALATYGRLFEQAIDSVY